MHQIARSRSALPGRPLAALVVAGAMASAVESAAADTLTVPVPYPTIEIAVFLANDGDEVVVSPGVYHERIDLDGKSITVRSLLGPKTVTIDGQGLGAVFTLDQGEGPGTVIDGFTITGSGDGFFEDAMIILSSAPTVRNCRFVDNPGSGMYIDHSGPTVTDCAFVNNTGGGLVNIGDNFSKIVRCTFVDNERSRGGAIINVEGTPEIISCTFVGNRALDDDSHWGGNGGAIFNQGFTFAQITNCLFVGNTAERAGGAIYNEVSDRPEGTHITNCTFAINTAPEGAGGAVHSEFGARPTTIRNCVLWDNTPDEVVDVDSVPAIVSNSVIEGGWSGPGSGNIDADPRFVDPASDDYRLGPGSPAIDAGDSTAVPGDTADLDGDGDRDEPLPHDLDGQPRFADDTGTPDTGVGPSPIADMGAYEFQGTSCRADVDESGHVDFPDLLAVLTAWGACARCPEDVDIDGIVGFADLLIVLSSWGPCEGLAQLARPSTMDAPHRPTYRRRPHHVRDATLDSQRAAEPGRRDGSDRHRIRPGRARRSALQAPAG